MERHEFRVISAQRILHFRVDIFQSLLKRLFLKSRFLKLSLHLMELSHDLVHVFKATGLDLVVEFNETLKVCLLLFFLLRSLLASLQFFLHL